MSPFRGIAAPEKSGRKRHYSVPTGSHGQARSHSGCSTPRGTPAILEGSRGLPAHARERPQVGAVRVPSAVAGAAGFRCFPLERKYWPFLGFIFFFEPEVRGFEFLPARQDFERLGRDLMRSGLFASGARSSRNVATVEPRGARTRTRLSQSAQKLAHARATRLSRLATIRRASSRALRRRPVSGRRYFGIRADRRPGRRARSEHPARARRAARSASNCRR